MKKPLILLHGALGSKDQFDELSELLREDFDIRTLNFAGHGGKVCTEAFSIEVFAHDLHRFMEMEHIEKADLFGYSMGGYIALRFAADHPDMVGKIMTLGTKFDWSPESAAREVKMLDPVVMEEKVPQFTEILQQRHDPIDWKEVVHKTADMMQRLGDGEAMDLTKLGLQHEVQICVGDLDRVVKFGEAVMASRQLPNATFVPIPGGKHPLEQVDANVLAEKIRSFFS